MSDDVYAIRARVGRWFRVRAEHEGARHIRHILEAPHYTTEQRAQAIFTQMANDALHSALLVRLLEGKEPLPEPPPLRHAYPDYEAAEGGGPLNAMPFHGC